MGYGTIFKTDIYLNRMTFQHRHELDDKIEELEYNINEAEKEILMIAANSNIVSEPDVPAIYSIKRHVQDLIEGIKEDYALLQDLQRYAEYLDETGEEITKGNDI